MMPRWSRLALAAILACGAFGASPVQAEPVVDGGDCLECPCRDAGPSLVVAVVVVELDRAHGARPLPLCAPAAVAQIVPRTTAVDLAVPPAADQAPAPREAPWRLAPKTSPPRR